MTIAEYLQAEFKETVDDDTFGEDIVYTSAGTDYAIRAHVYRNGITSHTMRNDRATENKQARYDTEIRISSHATYGRAQPTMKSEYVTIAKDLGMPPIKMRCVEIIDQDPGTWRIGLAV